MRCIPSGSDRPHINLAITGKEWYDLQERSAVKRLEVECEKSATVAYRHEQARLVLAFQLASRTHVTLRGFSRCKQCQGEELCFRPVYAITHLPQSSQQLRLHEIPYRWEEGPVWLWTRVRLQGTNSK